MPRKWVIYKHTSPSGKAYIGQTNNLSRRDGLHKCTDHCRAFARAIKKYGWDNFEHETLEDGLTLGEANILESWYIEKHGTLTPNGYNLQSGGRNFSHSEETKKALSDMFKGRIFSEEHRAKLSEVGRGRKLSEEAKAKLSKRIVSDETKKKIGETSKGRQCSLETRAKLSEICKGRTLSPETRAKLSLAHKGKTASPETKLKISLALKKRHPVKCINPVAKEILSQIRSVCGKPLTRKGHICTPETRIKIATSKMGSCHTEESKLKMSLAKRGKVLSEETKLKISMSQKRRILSKGNDGDSLVATPSLSTSFRCIC